MKHYLALGWMRKFASQPTQEMLSGVFEIRSELAAKNFIIDIYPVTKPESLIKDGIHEIISVKCPSGKASSFDGSLSLLLKVSGSIVVQGSDLDIRCDRTPSSNNKHEIGFQGRKLFEGTSKKILCSGVIGL